MFNTIIGAVNVVFVKIFAGFSEADQKTLVGLGPAKKVVFIDTPPCEGLVNSIKTSALLMDCASEVTLMPSTTVPIAA